jgi:flagellar basal-body rod protein FlgC
MLDRIFDIAGQGMSAQSVRLNTVASNLANANSPASSIDQVYRARHPVFSAVALDEMKAAKMQGDAFEIGDGFAVGSEDDQASFGVQIEGIVESQAALERRYEPNHPLADEEGYVSYPNVNVMEEMADMIAASRSFQINVELMQTAKSMAQRVLQLGQA